MTAVGNQLLKIFHMENNQRRPINIQLNFFFIHITHTHSLTCEQSDKKKTETGSVRETASATVKKTVYTHIRISFLSLLPTNFWVKVLLTFSTTHDMLFWFVYFVFSHNSKIFPYDNWVSWIDWVVFSDIHIIINDMTEQKQSFAKEQVILHTRTHMCTKNVKNTHAKHSSDTNDRNS